MHDPPQLTLDTNVPYRLWDNHARRVFIDRLVELAAGGLVDLAVTRHIDMDIPHDPLASRIAELPPLGMPIISGVAVLDWARLDVDMLGEQRFVDAEERLRDERRDRDRKLPDAVDFMHLHAHLLHGRDIFLTWDEPILDLADWLDAEFGIVVKSPEAFLDGADDERADRSP